MKDSPVERGAARCSAARSSPSDYSDGGWQGFEFVTTLSGCLVSWIASGSADDLGTAIKYWNVLLDDYQTVGDGAGGDDVVTHDTGYAMRTFAPYSAVAYDWLHDAPGVSSDLLAHARERFDAWVTYYTSGGYLKDMPGANYEAGYAFAATLIAIAEAGEAGSAGDTHWATVHDTIWGKDLIPALAPGGVLEGGDWPEGWEYGPLSVLELGFAARAMIDNGNAVANADTWANALVLRFANGLTPATRQAFVGGDTQDDTPEQTVDNGPLLAALAAPASDQAKSWARELNQDLALENDNPLFDAVALAQAGSAAALPSDLPTNYLGKGAGNWYARGDWTDQAVWSVFQCTHRLVDDHEHNDAGNFVLTRGADDLVVDPSPYGTLSTLTSNAPAVDSNILPDGYSPSQGNWGKTTALVWERQSSSGIAVARCDYADQFRSDDYPSDVSVALRDFVLVPDGGDGEVVLVDRVVTGDASRGLHLRVRTPGDLALKGDLAQATLGASALSVEHVWSSSGAPSVREMPQASECPSSDHTCDVSRLPAGSEYRIDVDGPSAMALHVVSARAGATGAHDVLSGDGYRGVVIPRASGAVAVVTNGAVDGTRASSLVYDAPASAVHVVVDAPVDTSGKSDVAAAKDGTNCRVTVTPHTGSKGGYDGSPLVVALAADCTVTDDGAQMMPPMTTGGGSTGAGGKGGTGGTSARPTNDDSAGEGGFGEGGMGQAGEPSASVSGGTTSSAANGGTSSGSVTSFGSAGTSGSGGAPGSVTASSAAGQPATLDVPDLSPGCSVSSSPSDRGAPGSFAGALIGLALLGRKRRRAGSARR
ncbi:MAG TPA: hypothetical protein VMI54_09765 [Polyangiaceae bacterium]|nr:hypothetical protein [Polyangiaceae bacterium]